MSPEALRELGKAYFFNSNNDNETRALGLDYLIKAHQAEDPEADYYIARFALMRVITPPVANATEYALSLLCRSANRGCAQARSLLNTYCDTQYNYRFGNLSKAPNPDGSLVDFDGSPIHIDRSGVFTPIDAKLDRCGDENVLTLSLNAAFFYSNDLENTRTFERAVLSGFKAWAGDYKVFGGQQLKVEVNITTEDRLFDNVMIMPITSDAADIMKSVSNALGSDEKKKQVDDILTNRRSFATAGLKWSVTSRKVIFIQSTTGRFDDLEEIKHVAKHEFGHALGLGDLYSSPVDRLEGVAPGTYRELDSYRITKRLYNLVMCDHHGPVSNNDIEMVILAFRKNRMQLYQPGMIRGKISEALGKGN